MSGYSPEEVVTSLYRILLERDPDPGGYANYIEFYPTRNAARDYPACVFNGARSAERAS